MQMYTNYNYKNKNNNILNLKFILSFNARRAPKRKCPVLLHTGHF